MTKDEILQLIVEQKFIEAFKHLTKKFEKTNAVYNDLVNDYINQASNFNEVDYSSRLSVFVSFNY